MPEPRRGRRRSRRDSCRCVSVNCRELLWWTTFWDIECLVLALGLLWLTVRTFDGCFGRIPERPRRMPVLSDVVVVLAGLVGVGGLFGAIAIWINGTCGRSAPGRTSGSWPASLLVAVGFLLLSALAPSSIVSRRDVAGPWPWSLRRRSPTGGLREPVVGVLPPGPAAGDRPRPDRPGPGHGPPAHPGRDEGHDASRGRHGHDRDGCLRATTYVTTTDASGASTLREATAAEIAAAEPDPPIQDPPRPADHRRPRGRHDPGPRGGVRQPGPGAGDLDQAPRLGDRRERRPGPLRDGGLADPLSPRRLSGLSLGPDPGEHDPRRQRPPVPHARCSR